MDLALLAVTALGFLGVFLILPRERPTLARIGGLIGVLALGGLFLYLVRQMPVGGASTAPGASGLPSLPFYLFAGIMIIGSVGVISHPKPVYAALYFVLVTLAGAGVFVLLMAEFMAVVLIIVYAGAILVTYVFVIMLASQGKEQAPEYDRIASEPFIAVFVSFVLLGTVLQVMYPRGDRAITARQAKHDDKMMVMSGAGGGTGETGAETMPALTGENGGKPGNMQVLGATLYGHYAYSLELGGVLLTVALVGAVVIARKNAEGNDVPGTGELPTE